MLLGVVVMATLGWGSAVGLTRVLVAMLVVGVQIPRKIFRSSAGSLRNHLVVFEIKITVVEMVRTKSTLLMAIQKRD